MTYRFPVKFLSIPNPFPLKNNITQHLSNMIFEGVPFFSVSGGRKRRCRQAIKTVA